MKKGYKKYVIDKNLGQSVILEFWAGLQPEPILSVSDWADQYRKLSTKSSAEAGAWRTERTPYLKEIMDCLSPYSRVRTVVIMKGAQLGVSEACFNTVGCFMDISPCPILYVLPTVDLAKKNSKTRIAPMIESTPRLHKKIGEAKSRDSDNTILQKDFPGGVFVMVGANSASALRNMPVRLLVLDEIDGYPKDLDGEGSPKELAEARTNTFGSKKKICILSTPTIKGNSAIEEEFLKTDQRYYHVPCPHCATYQKLEFNNLRWEEKKYKTVRYICVHCKEPIEERYKSKILPLGKFISENKDNANPDIVGFHINSLYSPFGWLSWEEIAQKWDEAQGNVFKTKTFFNTVLGESYEEGGIAPPWETLYNRRSHYKMNYVNKEVCFLTCGVDIQEDRIELEILGFCKNKITYSIDYRTLTGDTAQPEVWEKLTNVLNEKWKTDDGKEMRLALMAVDSGFNTSYVYDFCMKNDLSKVIPIKGHENLDNGVMVAPPKTIHNSKVKASLSGLKLYNINSSLIKNGIYTYLKLNIKDDGTYPDGYCHFPQYDSHYFRMLTAEEMIYTKNKNGFLKWHWSKKYHRNEALDCRVYAWACAHYLQIDLFTDKEFDRMREFYTTEKQPKIKKQKKQIDESNDYF